MQGMPRVTRDGDRISMPVDTFDWLITRLLSAEKQLYGDPPAADVPPPCPTCGDHNIPCPDCKL